jgi:ABC-type polysaccharide/polyol phosphate transport system ATPase subunit
VHFPAGNKEKRIKDFFMCDTISGMSNDVSQNAQEVEIKKKNLAVELREIYKHFNIGYKKHENALFRLVRTFSGREQKKEFPVLNSVSFSVQKGEKIGIIGRNGSGKSTLLRLIGGIYGYDSGSMHVQGTARYISGFSQGLKSKLTMRDNIYLIGSIMGLTTKEVDEEFDSIVEFSGLEEFVDTKIYQFSSGMVTRLSFSIFIFCILRNKPDILLLDEVIGAGGDIDFTKKANAKMVELIGGDSTVLFVSHGLGEIERFCSKAIWLEKGNIVAQGDASVVCNKYKNSVNG